MANSLSRYSITENIYCSQLSSVEILMQPEPDCFTSYNTRKGLCSVSLCDVILRSPASSHVSTSNGQRSSQLFCVHRNFVKSSALKRKEKFRTQHIIVSCYGNLCQTINVVCGASVRLCQSADFNVTRQAALLTTSCCWCCKSFIPRYFTYTVCSPVSVSQYIRRKITASFVDRYK
jgi:hypothetical protein